MGKNRRQPAAAPPRRTVNKANSALFSGVVCLILGFLLGYVVGQNTDKTAAPSASSAPPTGSVPNVANFAQDEAALKAALAQNPKDAHALVHLGNLYYDHGQFREAVLYYGQALDIDPRDVNVRTDRGTCYWNLGQTAEAIAEFQKSLAIDPSHPQTLYNLGVVELHGRNDAAAAKKAWTELLARNPGYPDRAKVEQQIAALSSSAQPAAAVGGANPKQPAGVEELLQRLKTNP